MAVALGKSGFPPAYGVPQTVTLASGVITVSGPGQITICAEVLTTGNLTQVLGLTIKGQRITVMADAGDTITAVHGTYLRLLRGVNFGISGNFSMVLEYIGDGICMEISRSPNS